MKTLFAAEEFPIPIFASSARQPFFEHSAAAGEAHICEPQKDQVEDQGLNHCPD